MASKIVDVFDSSGAKLSTYSITLENNDCLDAEFEEVALIFAETSGTLSKGEIAQLSARCEIGLAEEGPEQSSALPRRKLRKNAVVSLIKHRMKRAGTNAIARGRQRAV
jgi:hypothetical protein